MAAHPPASPRWEHFTHSADIGVRGYGATLAEAFAQAALALTAVVSDPASVQPQEPVMLQCQAPEAELLLVEWLNALIFEMATRRMLFSRFALQIDQTRLQATAWGEAIDRRRHQPAVEAKGATYTELRVARQADGTWLAQCVIDV
jgi:SHS2 domain-containing protein